MINWVSFYFIFKEKTNGMEKERAQKVEAASV